MSTKSDAVFEKITNRLIEMIESGDATWQKPWQVLAGAGVHTNFTTTKAYRGMNQLALMMEAYFAGYAHSLWATYKQWESKGAQVQKGQHGTQLIKWGRTYQCITCKSKGRTPCSAHPGSSKMFMWSTAFTVFNIAQTDAEVPERTDDRTEPEKLEDVEAFIANTGVEIVHVEQNRAFYSHGTDMITLPLRDQFETQHGYYGTALHELTHWTGHESRNNREAKNVFGSEKYAAEELVAELGSVFLQAHLGITLEPHKEHAAYLAGWLDVLKADPRNIYKAAKQAEAAVAFLVEAQPVEQEVAA